MGLLCLPTSLPYHKSQPNIGKYAIDGFDGDIEWVHGKEARCIEICPTKAQNHLNYVHISSFIVCRMMRT